MGPEQAFTIIPQHTQQQYIHILHLQVFSSKLKKKKKKISGRKLRPWHFGPKQYPEVTMCNGIKRVNITVNLFPNTYKKGELFQQWKLKFSTHSVDVVALVYLSNQFSSLRNMLDILVMDKNLWEVDSLGWESN